MCQTWPTIDEMLKTIPLAGIEPDLEKIIRQRYDEHGMEYATDENRDGLPINGCINKNTLQDIEEELVDTCFNALVLCFKARDNFHFGRSRFFWDKLMNFWFEFRELKGQMQ